ncbi:MAG TPA: hypothetical protein PKE69_09050 [Pyrinomonadaceae bacterium]|nr:hypothetical protein [Pyrinomonadaceae bacterium]
MTLAADLAFSTLDKLRKRLSLTEVDNIPLTSPMMPEPVGKVQVFSGGKLSKAVYIGMSVPFIKLDSHMIFAFTKTDSAIPHFTLDSVNNDTTYAFHLDLIPRVDLGANLEYIDAVYGNLSEEFEKAGQIEGLSKAHLNPRQLAVMSPWMLVNRAEKEAFEKIFDSVDFYLKHWFSLIEKGVDVQVFGENLAERDRRNREIVFNPEVDKVWMQVDRLVGAEMSAKMREILKSQSLQ